MAMAVWASSVAVAAMGLILTSVDDGADGTVAGGVSSLECWCRVVEVVLELRRSVESFEVAALAAWCGW